MVNSILLLVFPFTKNIQVYIFFTSLLLASSISFLFIKLTSFDNSYINKYPYPYFITQNKHIRFANQSAKQIFRYWQKKHSQKIHPDLQQIIEDSYKAQLTKQFTEIIDDSHLSFLVIPRSETIFVLARDASEELRADQMKSEFVSMASHQLRTPLTAIKWLVQRLEKPSTGELNDKQKEIGNKLKESSVRMINLVNDLLNISRIETGRMSIQPQDVNLKETIQSLVNDMQTILEQRNQTLNINSDENFPLTVQTDPLLLKEVINNILSNASKYSPEAGKIEVNLLTKENDVELVFKDSGYGIPKEEQIHIFDRFYRASNAVTKDIEGTGLGLYMSKIITKSLGGDLTFKSSPTGSTFTISLPINGLAEKKSDVTLLS